MSDAETQKPVSLVDLLSRPMSDFPTLPDLPAQKWFYGKLLDITADHSTVQKTPFYHFSIRITDPGKDVTTTDLKAITDGGFNLADYEAGANFYLTPKALPMFNTFIASLGFPDNVSFIENLALDPETVNPTEATREKIKGLDVMFRTPQPYNGRVYLQNVDQIAGMVGTGKKA